MAAPGVTVLPTIVVRPDDADIVTNPLHGFASYSYAWSLWWLDIADYNALMSFADAGAGKSYPLSSNSYVVAEDSGLYPGRRLPSTLGLNYNIQDVQFNTMIGLNSNSKSSNLVEGSMTIAEPYGVTFLDSLITASWDGTKYRNYVLQPYMLQLDFTGYDDDGNALPASRTDLYRKRFPISLSGIKVNVSSKGAEYKVNFVPTGHAPFYNEGKTLKSYTIVAGTIDEFFNGPEGLAAQWNKFLRDEVTTRKRQWADSIDFKFDPKILSSKIVDPKQTGLLSSDPNSNGINTNKATFTIPHNMSVVDIVNKIMCQSDFLIDQLGLTGKSVKDTQTKILEAYKVVSSVTYAGTNAAGGVSPGAFDNIQNRNPMAITYKILSYKVFNTQHPLTPQFVDSQPYTIKEYNYLYTGKNIDVIDFKMQFDTTYYTPVMTHTSDKPSTLATASTGLAKIQALQTQPQLGLQWWASQIGALATVPAFAPMKYKSIVNNQNTTMGFNIIDRREASQTADVMQSLFSKPSGDMVSVDLTIVGDPTLIKQDDWLYTAGSDSATYNGITRQTNFAAQFGHIKMDAGQLIVTLNVNTPIDLDTDITNEGGVFPPPGTRPALFSGQYGIASINNIFSKGQFTQALKLYRLPNSDYVTTFAKSRQAGRVETYDPATGKPVVQGGTVTATQNNLNNTNTSTNTNTTNATNDIVIDVRQAQRNAMDAINRNDYATERDYAAAVAAAGNNAAATALSQRKP